MGDDQLTIEIVKARIRDRGATISGVGRYCRVSKGHVSNVLAGRSVSKPVIKALAMFAQMRVDDVRQAIQNSASKKDNGNQ